MPTIILTTFTECPELDVRSALIYQQATLIKLSETYSRHASATTVKGSGADDKLVITEKINVICNDLP